VEPPSKQRKVAAQHQDGRRPASALGTARLGASTNMMRPQVRPLPGASHSVNLHRPPSAASNNRIPNGRPGLSQSYRAQPGKGHNRAKSQNTGLQRSLMMREEYEEDGKATTNGMPAFSISSTISIPSGASSLRGTRSTRVPLKKSVSYDNIFTQRNVSAPVFATLCRPASAMSVRLDTVPEETTSSVMSKLQLKETPKSCHPSPSFSLRSTVRHGASFNVSQLPSTPTKSASVGSKLPQRTPRATPKTGTKPSLPSKLNGAGESPRQGVVQLGSPSKQAFLSKDSNLTVPDWAHPDGIQNRLAMMEGLYQGLKTQMEGTTFERSSMKELIEVARARGMITRKVEELTLANWFQWSNSRRLEINKTACYYH
jgi:hypothetical protein